jgi:hypothetical protein
VHILPDIFYNFKAMSTNLGLQQSPRKFHSFFVALTPKIGSRAGDIGIEPPACKTRETLTSAKSLSSALCYDDP